ncbi:probable atp-dependent rna helicase ddx20 [Lichtheimia corymbifera JMRC:FSU:9682]|uniref:RNA helicase n=1 Tax=Lichtheimia corymbifera JMRC:FSU:9682 TaxID=1263082 RepID=A0A068RWH7_9FUNG|nr:probable atp-dependent rna helicase ddx20 [Lichtheimia corymbifera JMRC:FSU:9682]
MKRSRDVEIDENVDFEALVQSKQLVRGLAEAGYERPSPIQLQAIPLGRLGIDLIAQAKSGTGKTVVFSVIALESIRTDVNKPQVLVIAPTREIAIQIRDVLRNIGRHIQGFQCEAFIGGLSVRADAKKAPKCQVVIGTPGRLIQLMTEKILDTSEIRLLVLDEADRLMSEVFTKQIQYVYRRLPKRKQCIAFSATFSEDLLKLLDTLMDKPQTVRLTTKVPELEEVQQYYKSIDVGEIENPFKRKLAEYKAKFEAAAEILGKIPFHQCMIFINSVPRAMELSKWLTEMGWMSGYISGGLSQEQRLDVMEQMRDFKLRVLVCSDLIARGIDIDRVNLVINIEYPRDKETYMHRVGRTGRFGTSGIAVNLIGSEDKQFMESLKNEGVHIMPLPENVSYSEFRKILSDNEEEMLKRHCAKRQEQNDKQPRFTRLDKKLRTADDRVHASPEKAANPSKSTSARYNQQDEKVPHSTQSYNQPYPGQWHIPHPTHMPMPRFPQALIQPPPSPHQYSHQFVPPPIVAPSFPPTYSRNHNHFIPPDLFF